MRRMGLRHFHMPHAGGKLLAAAVKRAGIGTPETLTRPAPSRSRHRASRQGHRYRSRACTSRSLGSHLDRLAPGKHHGAHRHRRTAGLSLFSRLRANSARGFGIDSETRAVQNIGTVDTAGRLHPFGTVNVSSLSRPPLPERPGQQRNRLTRLVRFSRGRKTCAIFAMQRPWRRPCATP